MNHAELETLRQVSLGEAECEDADPEADVLAALATRALDGDAAAREECARRTARPAPYGDRLAQYILAHSAELIPAGWDASLDLAGALQLDPPGTTESVFATPDWERLDTEGGYVPITIMSETCDVIDTTQIDVTWTGDLATDAAKWKILVFGWLEERAAAAQSWDVLPKSAVVQVGDHFRSRGMLPAGAQLDDHLTPVITRDIGKTVAAIADDNVIFYRRRLS